MAFKRFTLTSCTATKLLINYNRIINSSVTFASPCVGLIERLFIKKMYDGHTLRAYNYMLHSILPVFSGAFSARR